MRGALITFEGVEGSGKTTQMMRLERWLRRQGRQVERTAEPDGTRLGVEVRRLFERPGLPPTPLAEVFLFMAARQPARDREDRAVAATAGASCSATGTPTPRSRIRDTAAGSIAI